MKLNQIFWRLNINDQNNIIHANDVEWLWHPTWTKYQYGT